MVKYLGLQIARILYTIRYILLVIKARVNRKIIYLQIAESLQKGIKKTISASGKQFSGSNFVK